MALFINGVGQDTFSMNGVSIDNLYVDGVLVWSSYVNTKPVITLLGSASVTITEGDTYIDAGATAFDATDGDITADIVTVNPVDPNTVGSYTITYNVTDSEGLAADEVTRAVEVEAVPTTDSTILYKLIEDLVDGGLGALKVFNSGVASPSYSGRLAYTGDGTSNEGDDFDPGALYPKNGTIDLTMQPDGKGSTYIDTYLDILEARLTQVAYDIVPGISYQMYALHNKGLGALDIYMGDSVNGYPDTPTYEITDYSPADETLKITSELPEVIPINELSSVYVSTGNILGTPPSGITINSFTSPTAPAPTELLDEDGVATGITLTWTPDVNTGTLDAPVKGDDTGFLFDAQQKRDFFKNNGDYTMLIAGLDSSHTYDFEVSGGTLSAGRDTKYTMNGNETIVGMSGNVDNGAIETDVTGVTSFEILVSTGNLDVYRYIAGINIRRRA